MLRYVIHRLKVGASLKEPGSHRRGVFNPIFGLYMAYDPARRRSKTLCHQRHLLLVLLLAASMLFAAACGNYASQVQKYSTEARSELAGSAFVLERFGSGEVSGPFARSSLQQYARAMQQTANSLRSLNPPPAARARHEQAITTLSRARTLVQKAGQKGVERREAPKLAQKLRVFGEELRDS